LAWTSSVFVPDEPKVVEVVLPLLREDLSARPFTPDAGELRSAYYKKIAAIAALGVGAALAATGIYFGSSAKSAADDVAKQCASGCTWADVQARDSEGHRAQTLEWVSYGAGAAAALGGAVTFYLGWRQDSRARTPPHLTVSPLAGGAAATWIASF
jgi:hypothetical protein